MKKIIGLLFTVCLLLASCSGGSSVPEGSRTINGSYKSDEMGISIGYVFMSDGFGYQLIGDNVYQIKYSISGEKITIDNFSVEGGEEQTFDFYEGDNYIRIDGIKFTEIETSVENTSG